MPRNWAKLPRAVFGEFKYRPPTWGVAAFEATFESMSRRPGAWAGTIVAAGLLSIGGWHGYHWWEAHKPRPTVLTVQREVIGKLTAPPVTPVVKGKAQPQPLRLEFDQSLAQLAELDKAGAKGMVLDPPLPGTWKWLDDKRLIFEPGRDWPAGVEYTIKLDAASFAKEAKLKESVFKFTTVPLQPAVVKSEFYTDPKDPTLHQAVMELKFTHPVERTDLEKLLKVEVLGKTPLFGKRDASAPLFTVVEGAHQREFWVRTSRVSIPEKEDFIKLTLEPGLKTTNGGTGTSKPVGSNIRVPDIYSGFNVESADTRIIRTDEGEPEQYLFVEASGYARGEEMEKHIQAWLLPKDKPADKDGKVSEDYEWPNTGEVTPEVLKLAKPVKLTRVETEVEEGEPLSTSHAFKLLVEDAGRIYVRVAKGVEALGGFKLGKDFAAVADVPEFPNEVDILGEGGLLALNGERKISIKSRGVGHVRYTLARVPFSQVNHVARFAKGDFQDPYWSGDVDEENIARIKREIKPTAMRNEYQANYLTYDFAEALAAADPADPDASRGLFFLDVEGVRQRSDDEKEEEADAEAEEEGGDPEDAWVRVEEDCHARRFILVTDLGLLVKRNADGSREVFVQSIQKGEPVEGVKIVVLAKNGEFISEGVTTADGHWHADAVEHLKREKTPVAIIARLGNDVSFIPFNRPDRLVDFSRFDTGGVQASQNEALDAFLFTERGVYRPGDTVHVSGVVRRRDWGGELDGLPVKMLFFDAKGNQTGSEEVALPADGFFDMELPTDEADPTGTFQARLYLMQGEDEERKILLGRTTFRLEDFQPDRMKLAVNFNSDVGAGWVQPREVKASLSLQSLFGFPAADRTIKARLELNPAWFAFDQFPDYTFHTWAKSNLNEEDAEEGSDAAKTVDLGEQVTDARGEATFNLALERFAEGSFFLNFLAEGFEKDGGRSVRTAQSMLVSPQPFVVGYKADGDLSYISKDSQRNLHLISLAPNLAQVAQAGLKQRIVEVRHVSVLTKQPNGSYAYESTERDKTVSEVDFSLPADGLTVALPSQQPGEFRYELLDGDNQVVCVCPFTVVGKGESNRSLDRNAELDLKLAKSTWNSGDNLELSLNAPYTGAGLITVEREKVLGWQWFKSPTTGSTQQIPVPAGIEGNAYVNVSFVRALDSKEIFMSPLSYAVQSFAVNTDQRKMAVELDAPALVKPNQELKIGFKASKPCRLVVYAVDEGIHQITAYKLPQPLPHFMRKRSLEVESSQLMDLILPEFSLLTQSSAFGGDDGTKIKMHLNPFKRKKEPPVVFWSGLVEAGPERKEVSYTVPDYFAGRLKIMAVAVAPDAVGTAETACTVRGPFVLSPNVPVFAAPGDEFTASLTVANNLEGAQAGPAIKISAAGDDRVEIVDGADRDLEVAVGTEGTARFRVRVKNNLGGAELVFKASGGGELMERRATLSVRPAAPFLTHVQSGYFRLAKQDVPVERDMYPQFQKHQATASAVPMGLARGLEAYLSGYPHGCSEQITSKAVSRLLVSTEADFGFDKAEAVKQLDSAFGLLQARQNNNGGFGYWSDACSGGFDFLTIYVSQFLTEAKDAGFAVPADLLDGAKKRLLQMAKGKPSGLSETYLQAAAIYLLTRQGEVTTNYVLNLRDTLESKYKDQWGSDLTAPYLAATYALLKQPKEGLALITQYRKLAKAKTPSARWLGLYYDDPQVNNALVFALVCRHFPELAGEIGYDDLAVITDPITQGRFNTISAASTILALKAYSQLAQKAEVQVSIAELARSGGALRMLIPGSTGLLSTPFSPDAGTVRFQLDQGGKSDLGAFYQVVEEGFDAGEAKNAITDGLEVYREFVDKDGNPVTKLKVGEGAVVRVHVRNVSEGNLENIAVLDLMPGGFEVEPNALRPGLGTVPGAVYVDVREDRNVFFCSLDKGAVKTFAYRIKPVAAGSYTVPPVFAEAMYDRGLKGRGASGKVVVE